MSVVSIPRTSWSDYARSTRGEAFADWCALHCVQSVDQWEGLPLVLEPWQRAMMDEALAEEKIRPDLDDADERAWGSYWSTVTLLVPKKNGKTSLLAAFALFHLIEDDGSPEILLAAGTDKQAGRLFRAATAFVRSDPWLAAQVVLREHEGEIARSDGFGVLYRVSGDSGAAAGYNPSLVVADELADWTTPRRRKTWADIATGGLIARRQTRVFVISTAGEPEEREAGILGGLVDRNEAEGEVERVHRALVVSRNRAGRTLVFNFDAKTRDPHDLDALCAANPASWITRETLIALAASPTLTPGRFLQLHGCVWTASQGGVVDPERWRELARPERVGEREEIVVGFRGAEGAALVVARRSDGLLDLAGTWSERDTEDVDDALDALIARQKVSQVLVSYTPAWATTVDSWRTKHGKRLVVEHDVSQPSQRTAAITERFREDVHAGRVTHAGVADLTTAMLAARVARHRNLPYLTAEARGDRPIYAAHAALLAWEGRAVSGPRAAGVVSFH